MSDHETTLQGLAGGIYIDASLPILHLAPAEKAACLAGADALRRGTCGTCKHGEDLGEYLRTSRPLWCRIHKQHRAEDDGCIKGYAPTEPTR